LEFFYKDEGEYERTHRVHQDQVGTLLNLGNGADVASTVEFILPKTREPQVEGAVFINQFARKPWNQGVVASGTPPANPGDSLGKCMTVDDSKDGYPPVVRMTNCAAETDKEMDKWTQQFTFRSAACDAGPIRSTADPSKCVDAVHLSKVLLTECSGVDSQKFQFRCQSDATPDDGCYILAMGGRKDMCLWFDEEADDKADLQLRSCNSDAKNSAGKGDPKLADGSTTKFYQHQVDLNKKETRSNTAPVNR
jgi:hypothetical protein